MFSLCPLDTKIRLRLPARRLERGMLFIANIIRASCLITALAFCSQFASQQAVALGATSATSTLDHFVYLPLVANDCNCYYVDSLNGSDANPGTSEDKAWRTLAPVRATHFAPGSVINFKRGSSWTGSLGINVSGTPDNPITFRAYGTGDRPILRNPGDAKNSTRAIVLNGDWIVVEGLLVRDTYDAGIQILPGADHNIVRDNEITNTGLGIQINSQYNLFTQNYVHDLHMVVNTPGGNDDYGAVAVTLSNASYNEISYNRMVNCTAPSYDYGTDGGAVEWWGHSDGNFVHHNWATGNDGVFEMGGGSFTDNRMAYNVAVNNKRLAIIDLYGGAYPSHVENFRFENNTVVEIAHNGLGWKVLFFKGNPTAQTLLLRNNIFYADGMGIVSNKSEFTHHHNIYYLANGTTLGFSLGSAERIVDPIFTSLTPLDLHLQSSSPAIDAGQDLGYQLDYDDRAVPVGTAPDLGAFEFQNAP